MIQAEIQLFGASIEIGFPRSVALLDARLNDFSARLEDPEGGFGLRPEQVRLTHSDILYGYELTASFFGGNAILLRNAKVVRLTLSGGKTESDLKMILQTVERFCHLVEMPGETLGTVSAHAHTSFESAETAQKFFEAFRPPGFVAGSAVKVRGGAIGYLESPQWPHEIRFTLEPSILFRDAAFLSWNATLPLGLGTTAGLDRLVSALAAGASTYGLDLILSV